LKSYCFKDFLKENSKLLAFKTNWSEIEEKVKLLLGKEAPLSFQSASQSKTNKTIQQSKKEVEKKPADSEASLAETLKKTDLSKDSSKDTALLEEYERLKNERMCVICLSKDKNVIFLPCAHFAACLECSMSLNNCPMCRSEIQARIRAFS
jgi:hypothetical protein